MQEKQEELKAVFQELKQQNEEEAQKSQFVREEYDTDFQNKVIGLLQEQTEYQRSIRNTMSGVLFILVLILIASGIVAFANFV